MIKKLLRKLHHGRSIYVAIPEHKLIVKIKVKSNLINNEFTMESYDNTGKLVSDFKADPSILFDHKWKSFIKLKQALKYMNSLGLYSSTYSFTPESISGGYQPSINMLYKSELEFNNSLDDDLPF